MVFFFKIDFAATSQTLDFYPWYNFVYFPFISKNASQEIEKKMQGIINKDLMVRFRICILHA